MKLQISTLITIITAAIVCGGFYSETCSRLDSLEAKVIKLEKKSNKRNRSKIRR